MAAKVSIASSTAARTASTHTSESSASREPSGANASNRFSSLMDAASQSEASSDHKPSVPSGPARSTSGAAAATGQSNHSTPTGRATGKNQVQDKSQVQGKSQAQAQAAKPTAAANAGGTAGAAGATGTNSSAATIDGDSKEQDSDDLERDTQRAERLATMGATPGTTPADASALTLLLSSPGGPVDGSNTSDTKSTNDDASKGTDDDASLQTAAAAGALAVNMIMGSAVAAGVMPNLTASNAGQPGDTGAIGSATTGGVSSASQSGDQSLVKFDVLSAGTTAMDGSFSADLSTLKSASGDSQSTDGSVLAGSAGSASIVRDPNAASTQSSGIERSINLPVGDRNWSGAVAGHVQWMVSNNIQSATLQLSPEHLGPVEVRIDVHQSQVNVSFTADHPETRAALEQSVPALREIFAGGGLTLGQTTVGQDSRSASQFSQSSARPSLLPPGNADSVALSSIRALGLVDEYA